MSYQLDASIKCKSLISIYDFLATSIIMNDDNCKRIEELKNLFFYRKDFEQFIHSFIQKLVFNTDTQYVIKTLRGLGIEMYESDNSEGGIL